MADERTAVKYHELLVAMLRSLRHECCCGGRSDACAVRVQADMLLREIEKERG